MSNELPIYFPFTFIEPERIERIFPIIGKFKVFRVFEKKVPEELNCYSDGEKIEFDVFKPSSDKSVKTAHSFLNWANTRTSLDIKAVSSFFKQLDDESEVIDILGRIEPDQLTEKTDELLIRHEITLFLIQLLDRQQYEINSALSRIERNHKSLFAEPSQQNANNSSGYDGSGVSAYRLDNMSSRILSWLAVYYLVGKATEQAGLLFTDEKDAFLSFAGLFESGSVEIYSFPKALIEEYFIQILDDPYSFFSGDLPGQDLPVTHENIFIEAPNIENVYFAVPGRKFFAELMAKSLGICKDDTIFTCILSNDFKVPVLCLI